MRECASARNAIRGSVVKVKHVGLKQRKDKSVAVKPIDDATVDAAFDVWLNRGLHQLFDSVANEPIPESLLRLIGEDRGS